MSVIVRCSPFQCGPDVAQSAPCEGAASSAATKGIGFHPCHDHRGWDDRHWAVKGAHGVGRALAQRLVANGEQVLDVPAKLAARVRVLSTGHGRKTDPDDAVSVAVAARSAPWLRPVGVEDQAVVLHLLTSHPLAASTRPCWAAGSSAPVCSRRWCRGRQTPPQFA